MEKYFQVLVSEDSPEAWATLREQMPWNWAPSVEETELFKRIGLEELNTDRTDSEAVREKLENSEDGTIFGEFYLDPGLEINGNFEPSLINCLQIIGLRKGSTPSLGDLTCMWQSKIAILTDDFSPISWMVIVCPRCQLQFTEGDSDTEFSPEDCVFDDCSACGGTGEWEYALQS